MFTTIKRKRKRIIFYFIFVYFCLYILCHILFSFLFLENDVKINSITSNYVMKMTKTSIILEKSKLSNPANIKQNMPVIKGESYSGSDRNQKIRERRNFIIKMMKDAWDNYKAYAWGYNELKPIAKKAETSSIFGTAKIGTTIVDAIDTLFIMGLTKEYNEAKDWIYSLNFDTIKDELSVFDTTIRFVGGFLTMFSLTGDELFKNKAYSLAEKLLPAFDTPTGIPYAMISLNSKVKVNITDFSHSSVLSEFGTLHLEFVYLSDITGDSRFRDKVKNIREVIRKAEKDNGLYYNYFHPKRGIFTKKHVSIGGLGDSFYEYLLKSYIQTGDEEGREMYYEAMDAFENNGIIRKSNKGLLYFSEMKINGINKKMEHLACFTGAKNYIQTLMLVLTFDTQSGLLALGSYADTNNSRNMKGIKSRHLKHMEMAKEITNTCHESYIKTHTRIGPEIFSFNGNLEAEGENEIESQYILRPDVIESYFVLWRLTGDPKYREWGWDAALAIEKYCKVGPNGGYSGLKNVYSTQPEHDDIQQSFFLAETLKYLYLLFSSNDLFHLDEWVFNTEAHPLPIKYINPYYRAKIIY